MWCGRVKVASCPDPSLHPDPSSELPASSLVFLTTAMPPNSEGSSSTTFSTWPALLSLASSVSNLLLPVST
eukprot:scaffold192764_cov42-Prasinocladus_malaysianus.AAC.1